MPEVARTVGRYEIVGRLGRGGMAIVHLARQPELDRLVALKELSALHADDPSYAQRFLRESRLAGSLSHPNVVTVFDFFEDAGTPYIAMEYVEGGSLRPYQRDLSFAQIGGVMEGLTAGLMHAEECGIVHRDLKPENVMVTRQGRVKIADFGIAKATNSLYTTKWLTETGTTVGTPGYMAPEQAMGRAVGPWTDLYSIGCMAYELFVGAVPFADAESPMALLIRHINEAVPSASTVDPAIPGEVSAWIDRLLIKDPTRRLNSATEAWDELDEILFKLIGPRWRRQSKLPVHGDGARSTRSKAEQGDDEEQGERDARKGASTSWRTYLGPGGEPVPGPYTPPPEEALSQPSLVPPNERVPGPYTPPPDDALVDPGAGSPETSTEGPADYETFVAPRPARPPEDDQDADVEADHVPLPSGGAGSRPSGVDVAPATVPPHAPEPPPTIAVPARTRTAAERPRKSSVRRRRAVLVGGLALTAACVAAVVVASSGEEREPTAAAPRGVTLRAGAARLLAPTGWRPVATAQGLGSAFTLKPMSLAAPAGKPQNGVLAVGLAPRSAHNPTLLATRLLNSLGLRPGVTPDGEIVRPSSHAPEALRYAGLRPPGRQQVATIYAVPTSAGVVTVECVGPVSSPAPLDQDCGKTAASLRVTGKAYAPRPSRTFAGQVNRALVPLTKTLPTARRKLRRASSAGRQVSAARELAQAYGTAAQALPRQGVSPYDQGLRDDLATALRSAANGFADLAPAASAGRRRAYDQAAARAARGEASGEAALRRLRRAGYGDLISLHLGQSTIPDLKRRRQSKRTAGTGTGGSTTQAPTGAPSAGTGGTGASTGGSDKSEGGGTPSGDQTGSGSFGGTIGNGDEP